MDTCVRGFSFMPETKIDVMELQYIEGGELERNWKASRRERLREREQRIWKEFVVNEQDVLKTFCKDDPYQFLEQLPQNKIEEMLEIELQKMRVEEENVADVIVTSNKDTDSAQEMADVQHIVTFVDEDESDDCEMFHIFDDDKDDEISGPEDARNDSMGSPDTVRERPPDLSPTAPNSPDKVSSKSSENLRNIIENSVYCEKVKDLRLKLSEELVAIIAFLEHRDVTTIDPEDMAKMCRRATEFNARFNRNHLYQLQRQIHDVKRNNALSLPFAKHTQFQSQMTRITSLHQNMLQSFQIFHKSLQQTWCASENVATLRSLIEICREATLACSAAAKQNFTTAKDLFVDNVPATCDSLQATVEEYATKITNYIHNTENTNTPHSNGARSKASKGKKRPLRTWSKSGSKVAEADARLSMYSLDTVHSNTKVKSTSSKDCSSSATSKMGGGTSSRGRATKQDSGKLPRSSRKKSPRSRRPLMRGPHASRSPRARRKVLQDNDIQTMVEAVDVITCTSSHVSRDVTPDSPTRRKEVTPRRTTKQTSPHNVKSKETTPRKSLINTPRRPQNTPRELQRLKYSKVNPKSPNSFKNDIPKIKDSLIPSISIKNMPKTQKGLKNSEGFDSGNDKNAKIDKDIVKDGIIDSNEEKSLKNDISKIKDSLIPSSSIKNNSKIPKGLKNDERLDSKNDRNAKINNDSAKERRTDSNDVPQKGKGEGIYGVDKETKTDKDFNRAEIPARCDVTRILRQLCGGDAAGSRSDRSSGAKNAQLLCVNGGSPRQPSTPQLLRILEETIQKKPPRPLFEEPALHKDTERHRLVFNIPERTTEKLFQYRTKFVQHMITSPMYTNSVIGKPWEVIGRISDTIIDDLLLACANQMELPEVVQKLYDQETR